MTKEDFSLKKDVLQIQKKMADLELSATELKEALSKFDTAVLDDLKQRVEDVEDLTMVENAAVIELKNMLESTAPKTEQPQEIPSQLEERLVSLEKEVSSITVPNVEEIKSSITSSLPAVPAVDMTKFDQTINEIKTTFETLQSNLNDRISGFEGRLSQMKNTLMYLPDLNTLKTDLKNEVLSSIPDYNLVRSDMQSIVETFKSEFTTEKEKIETALEMVKRQLDQPLSEKAVEELGKIRNDWLVNNAKVEAVEKFVENFSNELNNLKPILAKLETFDRLLNLHEEVSDKLQSFKEFQDHIQDAVEKNEDVEKRIQREVNKLKNSWKKIAEIEETMLFIAKEVNKIKKDDETITKNLNSRFEETQITFEERLSTLSENNRKGIESLENRVSSVNKNISDIQDTTLGLDKKFESIENNMKILQDDMSVFQGNLMSLEQNRLDLTVSIADLQETKINTEKRFKFNENISDSLQRELTKWESGVSELVKRSEPFEAELENLSSLKQEIAKVKTGLIDVLKKQPKNELPELVKKITSLEAEVEGMKSLKPEDTTNELVNKINELESKIESVRSSTIFDEQLSEIISRLVFLESRLAGMEGMMQDMPRYSPIVVE